MLKKIAMAMALLAAGTAHAAEVMVSITNLTQGISFTPLLVAAHGGSALFNAGFTRPAKNGRRRRYRRSLRCVGRRQQS